MVAITESTHLSGAGSVPAPVGFSPAELQAAAATTAAAKKLLT